MLKASTSIATIIVLVAAYLAGVSLRAWIWEHTEGIHFIGDINRAREHGDKIIAEAQTPEETREQIAPSWRAVFHSYLGNYDRMIAEKPGGRYDLDYPPIRLLIMTLWSRLISNSGPIEDVCKTDFCQPLLQLNLCAELLGAIAGFLLVRDWLKIESSRRLPWLYGIGAGLLIWFDPSVLLDAHGWPQWDAWLVPFFLFAAWAAVTDRWLLAGILCGIGGGFKGQLWVAAPILVLWPLFAGRWLALMRILVGWAFGIACIHAMWVLSIDEARWWCIAIAVLGVAICSAKRWLVPNHRLNVVKIDAVVVCVFIASTIFIVGAEFNASFGWFKIGIVFGAERHAHLLYAGIVNNLPALLDRRFGWHDTSENVWDDVTVGQLLTSVYILTLITCAICLAIHFKRINRHGLIALIAPWIMLYTFMPQMRERYLLWGGAMSAIWIGVGAGPTLLHVLITLLSSGTILQVMLDQDHSAWPMTFQVLQHMHPDVGWAVLLSAAIVLYLAITPARSGENRGVEGSELE